MMNEEEYTANVTAHLSEVNKETLMAFTKKFRKAGKKCKLSPLQAVYAAALAHVGVSTRRGRLDEAEVELKTIYAVVLTMAEERNNAILSNN